MCATCGCSGSAEFQLFQAGRGEPDGAPHHHHHGIDDHSGHDHARHDDADLIVAAAASRDDRTVLLEQKVLAKNDHLAQLNRDWLRQREILAVNLMSSPGAGKTTLLERTARDLAGAMTISVIEGDQAAALDAERIRSAGCQVVQVNTGAGCHLDAQMVAEGLRMLDPPGGSVVVIENVGNLVCPALFDLGEQARVVLASVTEGDDKPVKYPHMFRRADLVLVSKTDLLPYVDFDRGRHAAYVKGVSPGALMLDVSATAGAGLQEWYAWLRRRAGDAA
jgi:hydrogenase nickel incorporation protein HypB